MTFEPVVREVSAAGRAFQERRKPIHGGFGRNIPVSHDPEKPSLQPRLRFDALPVLVDPANVHAGGQEDW
jgi:hypothetical protein